MPVTIASSGTLKPLNVPRQFLRFSQARSRAQCPIHGVAPKADFRIEKQRFGRTVRYGVAFLEDKRPTPREQQIDLICMIMNNAPAPYEQQMCHAYESAIQAFQAVKKLGHASCWCGLRERAPQDRADYLTRCNLGRPAGGAGGGSGSGLPSCGSETEAFAAELSLSGSKAMPAPFSLA